MAPTDSGGTGPPGDAHTDPDPRPGPRALRAMQDAVRRARERPDTAADGRAAPAETPPAGSPTLARTTLSPAPSPLGYEATQMNLAAVGASGDSFGAGPPTANGEGLTVQPTTLRQPAEAPDDERTPTRMAPASTPPRSIPEHSEPAEPGGRSGVDAALRASVFVVGAIVVALVAWLVVAHLRGGSSPTAAPAAAHHPATTHGSSPHRPSHATTTVPSGGRPAISSISPDRGAAGQVVTVSGANLFSPDGRVQVFFGGQGAATSCSSATTCQATVPAGATGKVRVTVVTQAGRSNALTFSAA